MSDRKVPPILVRSGEKMNFKIEKSHSTLTWVSRVANGAATVTRIPKCLNHVAITLGFHRTEATD
jgi:hypothetical protein